MIERYLHQVRVELPPRNETTGGARARLADKFPRTAVRRMTHLGLLMGSALEHLPLGPEDALVYASSYSETRALEDFLLSFPAASPLLFQTSIHPGGVQQVLIGRQQSIARLWPHAGRARLVEQALLSVLLEPAERVVLVGGEEAGTWMLEHGMASSRSFAFALVLTRAAAGAAGRLTFKRGQPADEACPTLESFTQALTGRHALQWAGAGGAWKLEWYQAAEPAAGAQP
jgi:hypothetical protein